MSKKLCIGGEIVSRQTEKCNPEDICPQDVQQFLEGLEDGEEIEIHFSSLGGDVFAGLQICSLLGDASRGGHRTIAIVTSIAASISSVIACACDELRLYEGAFIMAHLPWTSVQGNSRDLMKEISTLEQCKNSMVKIYKTKFSIPDEEIDKMLEAETWIDSDNYAQYGLACSIIPNNEPVLIAASIKDKFKNIPRGINMKAKKETVMPSQEEELVIEVENKDEPTPTPTPDEPGNGEGGEIDEPKEDVPTIPKPETPEANDGDGDGDGEPTTPEAEVLNKEEVLAKFAEYEQRIAELEKENEELRKQIECPEDKVSKEECEKRVSGMQASLNKQINDFKNQLKVRDEELTAIKAKMTSLTSELDNTTKELNSAKAQLEEMSSALVEKNQALEKLNSGVNAQAEELPTMKEGLAKCTSPSQIVAFLKSGKYIR